VWEGEYKKRDRYKEEMESYFKEEAKKDFQEMMSKILFDPPPELMQRLVSAMSAQQIQLVPTTQPLVTQCITTIPSSVASTANKVHYPVDDIDRPVACSLVIRYGINNHRTREVAVGLAIQDASTMRATFQKTTAM
jgi:hypothetical protein